jgi:transposase-like protein
MEAEMKKKPSYRCQSCGKVLPRKKRPAAAKEPPPPVARIIVERGGPVIVKFT